MNRSTIIAGTLLSAAALSQIIPQTREATYRALGATEDNLIFAQADRPKADFSLEAAVEADTSEADDVQYTTLGTTIEGIDATTDTYREDGILSSEEALEASRDGAYALGHEGVARNIVPDASSIYNAVKGQYGDPASSTEGLEAIARLVRTDGVLDPEEQRLLERVRADVETNYPDLMDELNPSTQNLYGVDR